MESVPTAAASALTELLEVSPQVDVAVIVERDGGRLLASAPSGNDRMADKLGALSTKMLDAAERARTELGREPITQVEIATMDGHVFVVADARSVVAAVTTADPTVGLVFYDLKTALRTVREAGGNGSNGSNGSSTIVQTREHEGEAAPSASSDAPASTDDSQTEETSSSTQSRWRRKKS